MTERKPPGLGFESWVEKQIREAAERGAFDDLPGAGKPLPGLNRPHDEMWWIKDKIRREGLSADALLPEPLRLRKEIERLPETVAALPTERAVRETVAELNRRVVDWLRAPSGPQVHVAPVDADEVVEMWRATRRASAPTSDGDGADPGGETAGVNGAASAPPRRRWWRRRG